MRIGDARVSTTEQNLGLWLDDLKPASKASVDHTDAHTRSTGSRPIPEPDARPRLDR
jgi:hypothetical protein